MPCATAAGPSSRICSVSTTRCSPTSLPGPTRPPSSRSTHALRPPLTTSVPSSVPAWVPCSSLRASPRLSTLSSSFVPSAWRRARSSSRSPATSARAPPTIATSSLRTTLAPLPSLCPPHGTLSVPTWSSRRYSIRLGTSSPQRPSSAASRPAARLLVPSRQCPPSRFRSCSSTLVPPPRAAKSSTLSCASLDCRRTASPLPPCSARTLEPLSTSTIPPTVHPLP
eukprot:Mycagemm_TRINITY_DN8255_c0_g1::TRINITY_DN8255_c0_g1_i1::g.1934::m.1934 type:complete len:225 gc:universal TRINITY_DN8255_c0_g1_i1:507-1181(+)